MKRITDQKILGSSIVFSLILFAQKSFSNVKYYLHLQLAKPWQLSNYHAMDNTKGLTILWSNLYEEHVFR